MIRHAILFPALLAGLLVPWSVTARDAEVRLVDGRTARGALEAAADGFAIRPADGAVVAVAWTNLATLRLEAAIPQPARPAPAQESFAGWEARAVGDTATGAHVVEAGRLRLRGTGTGLRANDDMAWFVHRVVEGDTELLARLDAFSSDTTNGFAGVMIRDNPGAATAFAALGLRGDGRLLWLARNMPGASITVLTNAPVAPPLLLRLARTGTYLRGAWSAGEGEWTALPPVPVNLGARSRAGFVAAGGAPEAAASAVFEPLALGGGLGGLGGGYPRLVLRDGSVLVAPLAGADASAVRLGGSWASATLSLGNVVRLEFQPLRSDGQDGPEDARPGARLDNGDFVEGRLRRADEATVTVDSLVFGPRRLRAGGEAIWVQLGAAPAPPGVFAVTVNDGSRLTADSLEIRDDRLRLQGPAIGVLEVLLERVTGVRRLAGGGS